MYNPKIFDELYFCIQLNYSQISPFIGQLFTVPNRLLVVFCDHGNCYFSIDSESYSLTPSDLMILHPNQQISIKRIDPNVKMSIIGFTVAMQDVMLKQFSINFFSYMRQNFIWHLNPRTRTALRSFYDLYDFNFNRTSSTVSTEIANSLFSTFLQMFYQLAKNEVDAESMGTKPLNTRMLAGKFFLLLNDSYKKHHDVKYYADQLCISSKYLTQLVKQTAQKTPKEIIDGRLGLEALFLLTKTSMNIQQISFELGFPDQSYFGRFFKRIFGISPMNYRLFPDLSLMEKLNVGMHKLQNRGTSATT